MKKTLINICGSERSGSTMLDLIVGNDPKAFSCGEIYALYRPWREHHFKPVCGCGQECAYLQDFKRVREDQFHKLLFKKYGFPWVIDSSKDLSWVIDNQKWVIQDHGRVVNLVIWKQPATFSLSYLKRGKNAHLWRRVFTDYYRKFLDTKLPFIAVCYDDFVNDPQTHLSVICHLIGMDYSEEKLHFWNKTHHQMFGSGGTARQVAKGSSVIFEEKEAFPEYEEQIKAVERTLAKDTEVIQIIKDLKYRDVMAIGSAVESVFNYDQYGKRPFWYYLQKMHLKVKRYFPESMA